MSFTLLALQGFGGVLAVVQREIVERKRWLTKEEFVEDWAVAQIMPGPNVVNISLMIGARHFGLKGAIAALAGMLTFPLILVLLLATIYSHFADQAWLAGALRGMGAVAGGLIAAVGVKLIPSLKTNVLGVALCAIFGIGCFICIAIFKIPLGKVLLTLGVASYLIAYVRLEGK
ncbi:chromate transporter [Noviherbaspirillum galbum]|nr:chromate transporter [Noviherbaspirillum galbum]